MIYMRVDMHAPELRETMRSRAARLEARITQLGAGVAQVNWPEGTAESTAKWYLQRMRHGDAEVAQEVLDVLVDETEAYEDQFWSTELGRALFFLGAFPVEEMSRPTVKAILGLRSRQRVHQLIVDGELVETQGGTITAESVRGLMARSDAG